MSIAQQLNFASWRTIYDAPENQDFRAKRTNPTVICPGDKLFIPDVVQGWHDAHTEKKHKYVLKREKTKLRMRVVDSEGKLYSNCEYELRVGASTLKGDCSGMIEADIDASASSGLLTIWWKSPPRRHCSWRLKIGHLDPVDEVSGVQARLDNLGFNSGPVDGIKGPITTSAVKAFQTTNDLKVDGIPGPVTQSKLKELHGC